MRVSRDSIRGWRIRSLVVKYLPSKQMSRVRFAANANFFTFVAIFLEPCVHPSYGGGQIDRQIFCCRNITSSGIIWMWCNICWLIKAAQINLPECSSLSAGVQQPGTSPETTAIWINASSSCCRSQQVKKTLSWTLRMKHHHCLQLQAKFAGSQNWLVGLGMALIGVSTVDLLLACFCIA